MERLQKVIANSGYCSRRKAEEEILNGNVRVNGKIITKLGTKVNGNDEVMIKGKQIIFEEKEYVLLNKPRGVITSTKDEFDRKTVIDLIKTQKRLYPVGRLDYDTTGALLLTNDGELANLLMHPKSEVKKIYIAKIEGIIKTHELKTLERGVIIEGKQTAPAKLKIKKLDKKNNVSLIELEIHEGRNHQVKKMFEAVGYSVEKLKREEYSFLNVMDLKSGEYRYLTSKEVKQLYNEAKINI
ncbi:MAG: pseudouridine synthase [Mycoplasmatota bacterium]